MRTEFQCIVHHPSYGVLTKTTVLSEKSFQRIQESSRIRQCQENPGNREDEICSKLPNEFLSLRSSSVMASWQSVRDCIATWIFSTLTYLPPFLPPSDSPKWRKFKRNTIFVNLKAQLASRRNCCSKKSTPSCTSHQHIVLVSTPLKKESCIGQRLFKIITFTAQWKQPLPCGMNRSQQRWWVSFWEYQACGFICSHERNERFISYIINTHFFHGNIWTHNWPAPNVSGFIAQLVEHRTSNREVTGSNSVEVLNFFQASLHNCINCVHCDDFFIFISFPQFLYDLLHISLTIIQKLVHKRTPLRKASVMASHPQYQASRSSFNTTNFLERPLSLIPLPLIQMFQSLLPTVKVWADSSANIAKRTFGVRNDYINIKKENTSWPTVLTTMQEKMPEVNILVVQSAKKNKQHERNLLIQSFGTKNDKITLPPSERFKMQE